MVSSRVGYRALDHLRMEKGYPGLRRRSRCARFSPRGWPRRLRRVRRGGDFVGREALLAQPGWGLVASAATIAGREGDGYLAIYGGEAVLADGEVVGRLRSAAYGFTVRENIAYAYLPIALGRATSSRSRCSGPAYPATTGRCSIRPLPSDPGVSRQEEGRDAPTR